MTFSVRGGPPPLETVPFWTTSEEDMYSTGMIWRDCNNDGVIDVFFSNGNDIVQANNTIYLSNRGWLPASASWFSSNNEYSGHCAVGDIDDDGFPDFLVSNYLGSNWGIPNRSDLYLNNGYLPEISPSWFTPDSIFSFSCALGDIDNDGDLDVAFATGEGYGNDLQPDLIYLNDDGSFGSVAAWQSANQTAAIDVAWGDINNDGYLDLAFTYDGTPTCVYYNQAGTLESTPSWEAGTNEAGNTLTFGDVDGNGWLDLIVAYNNQLGGGGYFRVYFNDGAGNLYTDYGWQSANGGYGSALALYDYDNDSDDDLAAGRWFNKLMVYENLGTNFSTTPVWYSMKSMVAEELAWVDIDGQGVVNMVDSFAAQSGRKLFYLQHHPLYAIDSVTIDGVAADHDQYCYDLVSGWVSLASAPLTEAIIYYRFSYDNDLTVANWDTFNMAFANTNTPQIDFYADTTTGWAPITIQFTDSTVGASEWLWHFGDGDSSFTKDPIHTYTEGGMYDVELEVALPEGRYNRLQPDMILALADTIYYGSFAAQPPGTITIPVILKNTQPMQRLSLPVSYTGDLSVNYVDWNLDGCRTEQFESIILVSADLSAGKLFFELDAGEGRQPLPPGIGPILNLQFYQYGKGVCTLDTTTQAGRSLGLESIYAAYVPGIVPGHIYHGMCGNLDGTSDGLVDLGDLTSLIDYLFITHTIPLFVEQANVDGSTDGVIDLGDLTYLIAYLFIDGPPPICPF